MQYNKIVNPLTGRKVNVTSKLGRTIIENYVNTLQGGGDLYTCKPESTDLYNKFQQINDKYPNRTKDKSQDFAYLKERSGLLEECRDFMLGCTSSEKQKKEYRELLAKSDLAAQVCHMGSSNFSKGLGKDYKEALEKAKPNLPIHKKKKGIETFEINIKPNKYTSLV